MPSCAAQSKKNHAAAGSHFGHAGQGPERDPDKATQLVERTEARKVSEAK